MANLPGGVSPFTYVYSLAAARFVTPAGLLPILLDFKWPYSYQLNFTVQREVARRLSVSAGYVGTLSHGLAFSPDITYPIFTSTATSSNYNNRRPILPGVLSSINLMQSNQTASYNSLQVSAKKSMSRDLSLSVFYTFGKSLSSAEMTGQSTSGGTQDFNNMRLEHGRSTYDQWHNFVATIISI